MKQTACQNISPHLIADCNVIVKPLANPIAPRKPMYVGTSFHDGGFFSLTELEADEIRSRYLDAVSYVRKILDARCFLYGNKPKWCLYLDNVSDSVLKIPLVKMRIEERMEFLRKNSSDVAFQKRLQDNPKRQLFFCCPDASQYLAVPRTTTETRLYLPVDIVDQGVAVNDGLYVIINGNELDFAVLSSKMHMLWIRIASGRMKKDLRYSGAPVYNTFPWPPLTPESSRMLGEFGHRLLEVRRQDGRCLADLYDPDRMPDALRDAHARLDAFIERLYCPDGFGTDADRLSCLLRMYADAAERNFGASQKSVDFFF